MSLTQPDPAFRLECFASPWKHVGILLGGVALIAAGVFCTTRPGLTAQIAGWFGIVFFSACLIPAGREVFRSGPVLIIDENGIFDARFRAGAFLWEDIAAVSFGRLNSARFLVLHLKDPEAYQSRLSLFARILGNLNQSMGFGDASLSLVGLTPDAAAVERFFEEHSEAISVHLGEPGD